MSKIHIENILIKCMKQNPKLQVETGIFTKKV